MPTLGLLGSIPATLRHPTPSLSPLTLRSHPSPPRFLPHPHGKNLDRKVSQSPPPATPTQPNSPMETPNTRSRRKRQLQWSSQEETVTWGRDDQLLREVMEAGPSDKPLPAPSPTQRPRPIGASSSVGLTASAHPRKRPCRIQRVGSTPMSGSNASRDTPPAEDTGRRLDELLDRFLDISRPSSTVSTPVSRSTSGSTVVSSASTSSGRRHVRAPVTRKPMSERSHNPNPVTATRSLSPLKTTTPLPDRRTASTSDLQAKPRFRAPAVPSPPVRSSPRRAAAAGTPVRAAQANTTTRPVRAVATPSRTSTRTHAQRSALSAQAMLPPPEAAQLPSSDGDTSIDSLDELFQGGGEEIEALLAAVDGGR